MLPTVLFSFTFYLLTTKTYTVCIRKRDDSIKLFYLNLLKMFCFPNTQITKVSNFVYKIILIFIYKFLLKLDDDIKHIFFSKYLEPTGEYFCL